MFHVLGEKIKEQREEVATSLCKDRNAENLVIRTADSLIWNLWSRPKMLVMKCYSIHDSVKYNDMSHAAFRACGKHEHSMSTAILCPFCSRLQQMPWETTKVFVTLPEPSKGWQSIVRYNWCTGNYDIKINSGII